MKKKKEHLIISIISILAIVAIVFMIMIGKNSVDKKIPNIVISIDNEGNVYDEDDKFIGNLADPNIKFYDDRGNFLGEAALNIEPVVVD
jgi:flagellar basal body-associated protein FliL